ncbi:MAG: VTT domain-containing protein [Dehalococcoidia bacterium]
MLSFTLSSISRVQRTLFGVHLTLLQKFGLFLLLSVLLAVLIFLLRSVLSNVGPWGYPLGFVVNGLSSATFVIPTPGFAIVVLMAQDLNPIALGIVAGVGGTLGEVSGYWIGTQCRLVLKGRRLFGFMNKYMDRFGGGIIFVSGLLPIIPVDVAGLLAGSTKYPVRKFLVYLGLGKILMTVAILYVSVKAFDWAEPYIKWFT